MVACKLALALTLLLPSVLAVDDIRRLRQQLLSRRSVEEAEVLTGVAKSNSCDWDDSCGDVTRELSALVDDDEDGTDCGCGSDDGQQV